MADLVTHESAALTLPGEIGETGLSLPPGLAYEEWESVGSRLQGADDSLKWWIGDWLAYGERKYGETYAAAIDKTGHTVERLRQYKWVAERVPPQNRYSGNGFSWSKHRAVASLDALAQPKVLEAAVEHGWSSADIAKRIKAAEAGNAKAFTKEWQPAPRLSSQTVDEEDTAEADTPVMDTGAFGEGMSAERGEGSNPETDGFDDIERMRKVWAKMTPDLHIRFLRSIMTADLFMQVAPDFQQSASRSSTGQEQRTSTSHVAGSSPAGKSSASPSGQIGKGGALKTRITEGSTPSSGTTPSSSHVEHMAPTAAPCEAPAKPTPAVSIPVQTPAGGGSHSEDPLEIPGFLKRSTEAV